MSGKASKSDPALRKIKKRLDALEDAFKNRRFPAFGQCIDFSILPPGTLPNNYSVTLTGRTVTFSTNSPLGLEIKPNPVQYNPGLRVPSDLRITLSATSTLVEFEVSSYGDLNWQAVNSAGVPQMSVPPPPAPHNIGSHAVKLIGTIDVIEFIGRNEECIRQICFS